ncbi:succinate receptor 1-like [Hypomesus transpacificus]|uniref:succinate receptor 1-like n=1 Tax=Hypomesus transpacificus TaxID=137520 RepID=UPI001F07F835|nr:succinate receptor 1-like [Hypomesus transpacificus]
MESGCRHIDGLLKHYYLSPCYAIQFALGFPSNLLVVFGYIFCLPKWESINVYLFNLAVSDLIFLCTLPRLSYLYANDQSESSPYLCIVNRYILHVNLYSSILFMVWVSVDRLLRVRYPSCQHFLLGRGVSLGMSGLSWALVNLQVAPLVVLMVHDQHQRNWSSCQDFGSLRSEHSVLAYSLVLTLSGYLLPLLGLLLSSLCIARILRVQQGALASSQPHSYRRPLRVVTAVAVVFLVLYTPYHVMRNVRIASTKLWEEPGACTRMYVEAGYILTRPLAFMHSVINPLFYFLMGDRFRELLWAKLRGLGRRLGRYRV